MAKGIFGRHKHEMEFLRTVSNTYHSLVMGERNYTQVMYKCATCPRTKTKNLDGVYQDDDFITD